MPNLIDDPAVLELGRAISQAEFTWREAKYRATLPDYRGDREAYRIIARRSRSKMARLQKKLAALVGADKIRQVGLEVSAWEMGEQMARRQAAGKPWFTDAPGEEEEGQQAKQ